MILGWGPCPAPPAACPADIDDNGAVDVDDLIAVILGWGNECNYVVTPFAAEGFDSIQDCMGEADVLELTGQHWQDFVQKCVQGLCEAGKSDCD